MKTLLNANDLSVKELDDLLDLGQDILKNPTKYQDVCHHKILATLFFEPSTRTRLSFESAMLSLGGKCLGFPSANVSSTSKGESVTDSIWTVSQYCDIIAMRHPKEGAPYAAQSRSDVPLINAGDGGHNHPTQTLTDLLTIQTELGHLDHLTIGFCGDLKYGRTVHSLTSAMMRYQGTKFVFIAPKELQMPEYVKAELNNNNIAFKEVESMEEVMGELDILYMTRIQQERFESKEEYERLKGVYILDQSKLDQSKDSMIVLHPLPRVNEISTEVDDDPKAKYFKQVRCGRYVRMALILTMLGLDKVVKRDTTPHYHTPADIKIEKYIEVKGAYKCTNRACISNFEEMPGKFVKNDNGTVRCFYCEAKVENE